MLRCSSEAARRRPDTRFWRYRWQQMHPIRVPTCWNWRSEGRPRHSDVAAPPGTASIPCNVACWKRHGSVLAVGHSGDRAPGRRRRALHARGDSTCRKRTCPADVIIASMLELGVKTMIAYLLGHAARQPGIRDCLRGVDIRSMGSGNAGATNALRTQGKLIRAIMVLLVGISLRESVAVGLAAGVGACPAVGPGPRRIAPVVGAGLRLRRHTPVTSIPVLVRFSRW